MLDHAATKEFLQGFLETNEAPDYIDMDDLTKIFIPYCEADQYEWMQDNAKSFFQDGAIDWEEIAQRIKQHQNTKADA